MAVVLIGIFISETGNISTGAEDPITLSYIEVLNLLTWIGAFFLAKPVSELIVPSTDKFNFPKSSLLFITLVRSFCVYKFVTFLIGLPILELQTRGYEGIYPAQAALNQQFLFTSTISGLLPPIVLFLIAPALTKFIRQQDEKAELYKPSLYDQPPQ